MIGVQRGEQKIEGSQVSQVRNQLAAARASGCAGCDGAGGATGAACCDGGFSCGAESVCGDAVGGFWAASGTVDGASLRFCIIWSDAFNDLCCRSSWVSFH